MELAELAPFTEPKTAPGQLAAVQEFANTLDVETGTDLLSTPDEFRRWLVDCDFARAGLPLGGPDLLHARQLRETIRSLLTANALGAPDRSAAASLRAQADTRPIPLTVDDDGRLELDLGPVDSIERFLAMMIGISFQAQVGGEWERLKLCRNDECLWAFYDGSRNRGGAWCEMRVCGNRIKNRHYRSRHGAKN